jgi:protein ImuB
LFGGRPDSDAGAVELIEQLQARLGSRAVYGVRRVSEHRPEAAWKAVISTDKTKRFEAVGGRTGYRPLWMLVEPMALETVRGEPAFPDVLNLESGPERIEAGWWDGGDIWRDYYIAKNIRGMRLWIFKDCRESGWYLHGLFG